MRQQPIRFSLHLLAQHYTSTFPTFTFTTPSYKPQQRPLPRR
ncbi:conserved hypothetical protein [Pseudomonas protegens Pf-5]|uniref:Uncharacterized protein n=1 Tax=Pseudomonas fluorescens (strain ATCC BAA-477 / NRRL B-23932 / Pf-5) TaxID=220664 RepID=Q4KA91_PSEF5|nr:conserved hypothetical protein [Pseudomonas protegens Pf-5]